MKRCPRCGETKAVTEFYKSSRTADGLRCYCKVCGNRDSVTWQHRNPDRVKANNARSYANNKPLIADRIKARRSAAPEVFAEYRARAKHKGGAFFNAQRRAKRKLFNDEERAKARAYRAANAGAYTAHTRRYRADVLKALPNWCDLTAIKMLYDVAARVTMCTGIPHEVDHIVPLRGAIGRRRVVSGLHVEHNLRVVPRTVNRSKSNIQWPHMPARQEIPL